MPKILAIDDKNDNLIALSALLKMMIPGCQVITATSGPEGIYKAETDPPDTILLDIKMPGMDGYEVCRQLKRNTITAHIPIIMISAIHTDSHALVRGLNAGADAYLAKPIDENVLAAQVKTALRVKIAEDRLRQRKDLLEERVQERTAELLKINTQLKKEIEDHEREKEKNKHLESQLRQSQKMEVIGTLAGGIAHDFNNILFPIFGYTEMLLEDTTKDGPLRQGLTQIMAGAQRARDLVQQILTVSRQQEYQARPLKPHLIINEVIKLSRSSLPATITIKQHINKNCGMIMADATQIHQIAMNLITNAFQAMADTGGKLTITLRDADISPATYLDPPMKAGHFVCLSIADSGPGIPREIRERIFDPYFTTKKKGQGTGLGLSIVNGIVQSHCGWISVSSIPGQGARFDVYLPRINMATSGMEALSPSNLKRGDEHILLVDDQAGIVEMEQQMLRHLGYRVTAFTSPENALAQFAQTPHLFDVVITDLTMPGMTGDRLALEIMKIRKDIPVILNTGYSESMTREKARTMGIAGFLMKPVTMETLSRTIRNILDFP